MKKTYPLNTEGKNRDRLLDAIKHDIRKYVARQRRVPLPAGVDYWDFECQLGVNAGAMEAVHFGNLLTELDAAAKGDGVTGEEGKGGADAVTVFILGINGVRTRKATVGS